MGVHQVTHTYTRSLDRNDVSLMKSGFIQQHTPARLCAIDLPGGHIEGEFEGSAWDHGPGGTLHTAEEADRLADILASFPTSEGEDAELLAGATAQGIVK